MTNENEKKPIEAQVVHEEKADPKDVEENKTIAALAYLIFFLPMISAKESKFAMFHANQALLLLIFSVAVNIIGSILTVILIGLLILVVGNVAVLVLFIMGIMNAVNGQMKELPGIGKYRLLK